MTLCNKKRTHTYRMYSQAHTISLLLNVLVVCVPFGVFMLLHPENLLCQSRTSVKDLETVRPPNPGFSQFYTNACFTLPNPLHYSARPSLSYQAKDLKQDFSWKGIQNLKKTIAIVLYFGRPSQSKIILVLLDAVFIHTNSGVTPGMALLVSLSVHHFDPN